MAVLPGPRNHGGAGRRLMLMTHHLRAAGAALASGLTALLIAGCGGSAPPPVMAHGVALREPAGDPRPYATADTAFGLDLLGAWCRAHPQSHPGALAVQPGQWPRDGLPGCPRRHRPGDGCHAASARGQPVLARGG